MSKVLVKNLTTGVAIARPNQMYGWPGLIKLPNNDLLLAASERKFHCCPFGRQVISRSCDGGKTWSLPEELYNSEIDDRDANLVLAPNGTIILSFFSAVAFQIRHPERTDRLTSKIISEVGGTWMITSNDNGKTWSEKALPLPCGNHITPAVLSDGTLITCGGHDNKGKCFDEYEVYRSCDMGLSWQKSGVIPCPKMTDGKLLINESTLLEVEPNHILGFFRSTSEDCADLYQTQSFDGGRTWSEVKNTFITGSPAQLLKLKNGTIMCSYSHRNSPYSIRAVFSYDNGETWDLDNIVTLCEYETLPDFGYPTTVELEENKFLTVYYCSWRDKLREEKPCDLKYPEGIITLSYELDFNK